MGALRFAAVGAGFWARPQLAAWREVAGATCVAICNRTVRKAEALASEFGIPKVYADPLELLRREELDFVDIITAPELHEAHVLAAASRGVAVICQKPMALSLASAERMVAACAAARVPFFVHENFRWQTAIREVKRVLLEGTIGTPYRARLQLISGAPVFENQPFFRDLEQFLLTDMGSHQLDVARYLFGEAGSLICHIDRIHSDIKGEDVATVMLRMRSKVTVVVFMAYAENFIEHDRNPETFMFIEGSKGSLELGPDYWVRVTTSSGTHAKRFSPPRYPWADPAYEVVQASIVPCHQNLLGALRGEGAAETRAEDNLETARLVFAAYDSAATGQAMKFS